MFASLFIILALGSFIPTVGTSCEAVKNCANEVVSLYGKAADIKNPPSYFPNAPSCGVTGSLTQKMAPAQFCYSLLSLVVTNFPCSTTPPPVTGSGIAVETPQEEDTEVEDDGSSRRGHHGKEGSEHAADGFKLLGAEARVWGFTICSVVGISVAGFACVLILPSMCTVCYNHFQQFLVAMAVGTLSGDAVLHLIPHSFFSHEDHIDGEAKNGTEIEGGESTAALEDSEQKIVIKGVVLLFGLFLLYTIEQLFAILPLYMAARRARLAHQHVSVEGADSKHSNMHFTPSGHSHDEGHGHSHGVRRDESSYHYTDAGGGGYDENGEQLAPLVHCQDHCTSSTSAHHFVQPSVVYSTSCEEVVFRLHGHNKLLEQKECSVMTPCALPCVTDTPCAEKPDTHLEVSRTASFKIQKHIENTPVPSAPPPHGHPKHDYKHGTVLHRCHSADNINVYCTPVCLIPAAEANGHPTPVNITPMTTSTTLPKIVEPEETNNTPPVEETKEQPEQTKKEESMTKYPVESAISIVTVTDDHVDHSGHGHGHSHGHGHGHSHSHFGDVNSRAWMVIMADAFHNMVDGMAIGVAFSASLAGGFSTAIAVAMHELPHELGDFAVLLKEGLSIKRGLMFNCISSVICLFGAMFGVGFGSSENFDQIIFALAAGVFLYVSLVDMLPQISSVDTSPSESVFCHLAIRCGGMLTGTGIMVCVALLETRIGDFLKAIV